MIGKPITTEKAIKLIEIENTILFQVDKKDNKKEIAKEIEEIFKVKVEKVNVLPEFISFVADFIDTTKIKPFKIGI